MKKGNMSKNAGFSLLELIVVISIMAVLGTVLAPQLLKHVNNNRITACKTDREAILAVYERCIYAQTKALDTGDLNDMLTGVDTTTWTEVQQYIECPSGGEFRGEVGTDTNGDGIADEDLDVAMLYCNHPDHDVVAVDFIGWNGTELAEGTDDPLDPPPSSEEPETDEPTTEEEASTEEEKEDSYWPYPDDPDWYEDGRLAANGYEVFIPVPSGLITTREGNQYVIVDKPDGSLNMGDHLFRVHWMWSDGPEYTDASAWTHCIPWSGVVIEDLSAYVHPNDSSCLTGIYYGDIVIY